ncbi:hypothetical protein B0H13DRAFT_1921944 [Mycena leptocephala]|nr:hypothetical protein B0H13DRAFT_1921944 [Mycena leptocephala]
MAKVAPFSVVWHRSQVNIMSLGPKPAPGPNDWYTRKECRKNSTARDEKNRDLMWRQGKMNGNPIETSSGLLQSNGFSLLRSQYCTRIKLLRKWSMVFDTKRKFGAHLLVVISGGVGNSGNIATTEGRSPKGGTIR